MASQQADQEIPHVEQSHPVSDAVMQQALDNLANAQSAQNNTTYTSQATEFMQQKGEQVKTMAQGAGGQVKSVALGAGGQVKNVAQGAGEQVMNMAQGATDAVKNTLGMNTDNTNKAASTGAGAGAGAGATGTQPSSLTTEHPSNPTNNINISSSTINPRV